jgi:hypothetical protein
VKVSVHSSTSSRKKQTKPQQMLILAFLRSLLLSPFPADLSTPHSISCPKSIPIFTGVFGILGLQRYVKIVILGEL